VGDHERDLLAGPIRHRRHPDLATFRELQRVRDEIPQDLRDLCLVGAEARQPLGPAGSSNTSPTASLTRRGRSMPRSAPNRSATSKVLGRTTIFPASTLA